MIISNPSPLPEKIIETIKAWEEEEDSRLFGLITTGDPFSTNREITRFLIRKIREECKSFVTIDKLDVLLDSSGGEADAAYQLVTFLRLKCETLRIFIPDWAKSAATLICLGADEIWMSNTAEMGPLDAQILDPRDPQEGSVSALEQFRAMDYLKRYSFEMLDTYVSLLVDRTPSMRLKEMITEATPFVTQLMASLYGQIDPMHFGSSYRALDVTVEYGKRLMSRYLNLKDEDINKAINKLTWEYPSHSFVIDRREAAELGLNVNHLSGSLEERANLINDGVESWIGFVEE